MVFYKRKKNPPLNSGFTLIEIMIALFIFAIISALAAGSFHTLLVTRTRIRANAERLQQLQLSFTLLGRDIEQLVNRSIIDNNGQPLAALVVKPTKEYIEFSHGGLPNPLAATRRSTIQRVAYFLDKNSLIRRTWMVLDRTPHAKAEDRIILPNITDLNFELLTKQGQWQANWYYGTPQAIRVTVTLKQWGTITRTWRIINNVALP